MKRATIKSLMLASFVLLCTSAKPGIASGYGLNVLVNGDPRTEYHSRGGVYIEAVRGKEFAIRLTNPTPYRVAVALSVDGLNTIDAKHTSAWNAAKWVLEPYESTVISGWQVNGNSARRFFFTGEKQSYGAALGQTANLGVIEAVYYRESQPNVNTYRQQWDQEGQSAPSKQKDELEAQPRSVPPAARSGAAPAQEPKLSDDYAATGMGRRSRHEVESVDIDLDPTPVASMRIRYEFHQQLVKLGVLPVSPRPIERREQARGFGNYCPEPD